MLNILWKLLFKVSLINSFAYLSLQFKITFCSVFAEQNTLLKIQFNFLI